MRTPAVLSLATATSPGSNPVPEYYAEWQYYGLLTRPCAFKHHVNAGLGFPYHARHKGSHLCSHHRAGGTGFRPGAVVTTSGTHYTGNVIGGAIVTGSGHASYPTVQVQGNHVGGGSPTVGIKTESINRGMRAAPSAAPSAGGMLVPDICRAPTACAFNIVGSFNQGPSAKPRDGGPAASSAVDGAPSSHHIAALSPCDGLALHIDTDCLATRAVLL